MPSANVMRVTIDTRESRARMDSLIALGRRFLVVRFLLLVPPITSLAVWWCARPALARRNWSVG